MNVQREKTGLMSGKLVLLALLATTIVMAPAVWVTQKWVRAALAIDSCKPQFNHPSTRPRFIFGSPLQC